MAVSLTYRRPVYVTSSRQSLDSEKGGQAEWVTSGSSSPYGIPDALSFDRIISGGTCPVSCPSARPPPGQSSNLRSQPVSVREFMDFLRYIEYDAENLQFYLWYRDYCKRFSELPESEQVLAKEWTPEQALAEKTNGEKEKLPKKMAPEAAAALKGTDFDPQARSVMPEAVPNPFNTPPRTPSASATDRDSVAPSTAGWSEDASTMHTGHASHGKKAQTAFDEAGALQPCMLA